MTDSETAGGCEPGEVDTEAGMRLPSPGVYDAFVVDARWADTPAGQVLAIEATIISGKLKGSVVDAAFVAGSKAFQAAASAFGLDEIEAGDESVTMHMIGLPCTLFVAKDNDGRHGIAVGPA